MLKQVSNILLDLYSLRLIAILNLEIVGCVLRFLNNTIIVSRKILVNRYVGIVSTLLGTRRLHVVGDLVVLIVKVVCVHCGICWTRLG